MVFGWLAVLILRIACESSAGAGSTETAGALPRSVSSSGRTDYAAALGDFLERSWTARPEWADMLAAILKGQGFEAGKGWWRPSERLYGWAWLKSRYDANRNDRVEASEIRAALRAAGGDLDDLDRDLSGEITESDIEPSREQPVSEVTEGIFRQLDEDSNERVSWAELSWFFQRADRNKRGSITREDLQRILGAALKDSERRSNPAPSRARTLELFLSGDLGSFGEGPSLGSQAPDFQLLPQQGESSFRPSSSRAKKPLVLIFGSFT